MEKLVHEQLEEKIVQDTVTMLQFGSNAFYACTLRSDDFFMHSFHANMVDLAQMPASVSTVTEGKNIKLRNFFHEDKKDKTIHSLQSIEDTGKLLIINVDDKEKPALELINTLTKTVDDHGKQKPNTYGIWSRGKTYINKELSLSSKVKTVMSAYAFSLACSRTGLFSHRVKNKKTPVLFLHSKSNQWPDPVIVNYDPPSEQDISPIKATLVMSQNLMQEQWKIITSRDAIRYIREPAENFFTQSALEILKDEDPETIQFEKLMKIIEDFSEARKMRCQKALELKN